MRSAIIAAAFAATAMAVPFNVERDVQTKVVTDVAYVTHVVTAGGSKPTPEAYGNGNGNGNGGWGSWGHWGHKQHKHAHKHKGGSKPKPKPQPQPTTVIPEKNHPSPTHHKSPPKHTGSGGSGGGSSGGDVNSYSGKTIIAHNLHRKNHSAPDVKWSAGLASLAAEIASDCKFAHVMGKNGQHYGQNIAAGVAGDNITAIITDMFYNGEVNSFAGQYGKAHPTGFEEWGHFSQLVWKNTYEVGCATQDCSAQGGVADAGSNVPPYFTVCNYGGPGNIAGQYAQNVGSPLGEPSANWATGL